MKPDEDLLETYDYELPDELIAAEPAPVRRESRLLVIDPSSKRLEHRRFEEIVEFLSPGDLLVTNNAKVIPARVAARKETGGAVEVFVVELVEPADWHESADVIRFDVMTRSSKPVRVGAPLLVEGSARTIEVEEWSAGRGRVAFRSEGATPAQLLEELGEIPLPPYIVRQRELAGQPDVDDLERYQTVFASKLGAVAAPTAGLHFDEVILARLEERGIRRAELTLEVGPGTFRPVTSERLSEHAMHSERYHIDSTLTEALRATKQAGGRVVAVGTTSMRTLEAESRLVDPFEPGTRRTDIFLNPSNPPSYCDGLITNFHLPKSTLLALVAGFTGVDLMQQAYATAVRDGYRFYSYGDANLILPGALP